jgi:hypothetical protein
MMLSRIHRCSSKRFMAGAATPSGLGAGGALGSSEERSGKAFGSVAPAEAAAVACERADGCACAAWVPVAATASTVAV